MSEKESKVRLVTADEFADYIRDTDFTNHIKAIAVAFENGDEIVLDLDVLNEKEGRAVALLVEGEDSILSCGTKSVHFCEQASKALHKEAMRIAAQRDPLMELLLELRERLGEEDDEGPRKFRIR